MSATGPRVLVVDDEAPIRKFLRISLTAAGYRIAEAGSAAEALRSIEDSDADLIVLDLGLPDADGKDLIAAMRARSQVPILVLSVRGDEQEKVAALDAGANDFVTKPFGVGELLARIRAALRSVGEPPPLPGPLEIDGLSLDPDSHRVAVDGQPVRLTPREFALLEQLMRHPGKVMTHTALLREVWGPAHQEDTHYLRIYIGQLRKKLGDDPAAPRFIANEPGVGYRMHPAARPENNEKC